MNRPHGILHWAFPAIVVLAALTILVSGRDLSGSFVDLQSQAEEVRAPLIAWAQRFVSVLLLVAAAERIVSHLAYREVVPSPALAWSFIAFWIGTVAAPAFYGSHPQLSHDFGYSLALGVAAVLAGTADRDRVIHASRDTLFLFMLISVALIPVSPSLVLDSNYSQGLLSGVPRLAGIAVHPVSLGMLALTGLLCLWHRPFASAWLNVPAWALGGSVLFLAQSKTAWISFVLCAAAMLAVRHAGNFWRRLSDPASNAFGILACSLFILATVTVMAVVTLGDVQAQLSDFLESAQGAQLISMTGRDHIWAVALEEWHGNWWFGYGPGLWDAAFRASIGMPSATHAHNQYMDTLARSGAVGATVLVIYAIVLLVLSIRYARATRGLSLALFLALAMRSVSEVPLNLFGYGTELFTHLLLVVTLASTAAARQPAAAREAGHNLAAGLRTAG
ncbi:MAG: putative rane protein [Ramlibacter sp.]|nr:putative rane protein [Ramlibacter sp.]